MKSFPVIDPATGATVGDYPAMTRDQAFSIVGQVHAAFLDWERTAMPARAERMHRAAAILRRRQS